MHSLVLIVIGKHQFQRMCSYSKLATRSCCISTWHLGMHDLMLEVEHSRAEREVEVGPVIS